MFKSTANQPVTRQQPVPLNNQSPQKDRQKMGNPANANHLMKILADVMKSIIIENGNIVTENLLDCQNDADFKNEGQQAVARNKNYQVVVITNKASIERSKFGEKYRQSLDARDQMLAHPFQFVLQVFAPSSGSSLFMDTQAYQILCKNIEEFIVDVVQNVISVSFNFLIEGKLKQSESKDFASKNILLNVYSVFKESIKTLTSDGIVSKKENKKFRFTIVQLIENCLNQVLVNLSSYYPQAPPTGGTPRMREALISIDRNYNQELDFFYTQKLKITREDSGDYTEFIMKVINRVIQVTGEIDPKDPLQQTLAQKFKAFSEHLFWVTQEDEYSSFIQQVGKTATMDENDRQQVAELNQINKIAQEKQQLRNRQAAESPGLFNFFGKSSEPNKPDYKQNNKNNRARIIEKKESIETLHKKQRISEFMRKPIFAKYATASLIDQTDKQKKVNEMKQRHDFAMGQKIPGSVKPFSKKDLTDKNFSAKSSAVLRMLTKWAENLENIFDNPQAYTTNRIYPFKTLNNEIIYPKKELKDILFKQITQRRIQKQEIKEHLINKNKSFQSTFFARDNNQDLLKFIKRYTETRVIASKMNALLIQFMKQYVSQLINLLVDAGRTTIPLQQGDYTIQKQIEINLVVFKIGDLMRSKIHCSETNFIRLLKTLYLMEQTNTLKNQNRVFELVRIKNKLELKDNNILINYLFMGKIQCELQMSVQNMSSGKELKYYTFAHFLYELTRGKFGVLAECATIISQHDPIVSSSASDLYYEPKKPIKRIKISQKLQKQQKQKSQIKQGKGAKPVDKKNQKQKNIIRESQNINKSNEPSKNDNNTMFICKKCDNLRFSQNLNLLKRRGDKEAQICNICLIGDQTDLNGCIVQKQQYSDERMLKDETMAELIISNLKKRQITKLTNYEQLSNHKKSMIFSINKNKNELEFSIFSKQQSQNIYYISQITKDLWEKDRLKEKNVQYEDITQKIKNSQNLPEFTYIFQISQKQACMNILKKIKFIKSGQVLTKLEAVDAKCQEKILKDSILNILRNKNQSLQFNSTCQKMKIMNNLVEENSTQNRAKWVEESLSHIQFVFAQRIKITNIPQWLQMCQKTQLINLSDNIIQDVSGLQNMTQIKELILKGNELKKFDFRKFTNLERLNISNNKMENFQLSLLPKSLLELDIGSNKLQKLNLQAMPPKLRRLDLFGNSLTTINIKQLPPSLQNLDLSYNQIEKIDQIKGSPLKELLLGNNSLTSFKISNMPNLQQFIISENKLQNFYIKNCPNLLQLHIGSTTLTKLEIIDFPSLTQLSIEQNQKLKSLSIKQLPSINIINMNSLILVAMDTLQIENLNQDGVIISGHKKLVQYVQQRFPSIQFEEEDQEDEKRNIYGDSDNQNGNRQ